MFYNAPIVNGYKQPSSWTRQFLYPGNRGSHHFALLDTRLDTTYTGAQRLYSTFDTIVSVSKSQPYLTPRAFQFLCSWIATVASCPCDGARMRLVSGFKIQPMLERNAISQAFGVFLKGRSYISQNMWRQSTGDVVFITGGLLGVSRLDSRDLVRN